MDHLLSVGFDWKVHDSPSGSLHQQREAYILGLFSREGVWGLEALRSKENPSRGKKKKKQGLGQAKRERERG